MKIVIDISQDVYDNPCNYCCYALANNIKNGTVLPEKYGDLIDRYALLKQPMNTANYPTNYVKIAPTILEGTK